MWEVMAADLKAAPGHLKRLITRFVALTFTTTQTGARRRRWFIIAFGAFIWARAAVNAHPITYTYRPIYSQLNTPFLIFLMELVVYPFTALFAADILRHVIVAALVSWLTLRLAASYLDDIFELGDISVAEKYILQAAFASDYFTLMQVQYNIFHMSR